MTGQRRGQRRIPNEGRGPGRLCSRPSLRAGTAWEPAHGDRLQGTLCLGGRDHSDCHGTASSRFQPGRRTASRTPAWKARRGLLGTQTPWALPGPRPCAPGPAFRPRGLSLASLRSRGRGPARRRPVYEDGVLWEKQKGGCCRYPTKPLERSVRSSSGLQQGPICWVSGCVLWLLPGHMLIC